LNLVAFLEEVYSSLELGEVLACRKLFDFLFSLLKNMVKVIFIKKRIV
jgi:hypothetical protein